MFRLGDNGNISVLTHGLRTLPFPQLAPLPPSPNITYFEICVNACLFFCCCLFIFFFFFFCSCCEFVKWRSATKENVTGCRSNIKVKMNRINYYYYYYGQNGITFLTAVKYFYLIILFLESCLFFSLYNLLGRYLFRRPDISKAAQHVFGDPNVFK